MGEQKWNTGKLPKPGYSLADIKLWDIVWGNCSLCGNAAKVNIEDVSARRKRPWTTTLLELQPLLKCTRCGRKGGGYFTVRLTGDG